MGQIVGLNAKPKRANLNALSLVPTPANGEIILVSSDNSMNAAGQGNFDCYIEGNGTDAATALPLHKIDELWKYFPSDSKNYFPPADVEIQKTDANVSYTIEGTTLSVTISVNANKYFYIKISNGTEVGKTYNVKFTATNIGTSLVRYSTRPSYNDVTITPVDGVYSFSFEGGTEMWLGVANARNKTYSLNNIEIKNANPDVIFDKSIIKGLDYENIEEEIAAKIRNAAQYLPGRYLRRRDPGEPEYHHHPAHGPDGRLHHHLHHQLHVQYVHLLGRRYVDAAHRRERPARQAVRGDLRPPAPGVQRGGAHRG